MKQLIFGLVIVGAFWLAGCGRAAHAANYYVDCNTGSDSAAGTAPNLAWKTVPQANTAPLVAGDSLFFKRGCTWTGNPNGSFFRVSRSGTATSPITIDAYGSGNPPILEVNDQNSTKNQIVVDLSGSYINLANLDVRGTNHYREPTCLQADGQGVPLGWYVGITISGSHNVLQTIEAEGLAIGVNLTDGSDHNKLLASHIHDLDALWRIDKAVNALGALGVNLHGDDNEVGYSLFERNWVQCNYIDNGQDQNYGAPFEIYNANRSFVHHNRAYEHRKHYEMGKAPTNVSDGNILAYNLFVSSRTGARGPNIHGSTNEFGPINNTEVYNNTIIFTGDNSEAIVCSCDGGAVVKNNIFVAETKAAFYSGAVTEDHNLYWDYQKTSDTTADPLVQFTSGALSPTSTKVNPLVLNPIVPTGDYQLQASSPAVNSGTVLSFLTNDLNNWPVPVGASPDLGAYEYHPAVVLTPTPTPGASGPVGIAGPWNLIWQDDFSSTNFDSTKWQTCYYSQTPTGCDTNNTELEWYSPNNISQANGILTLQAKAETITAPSGEIFNYTSGMLTSDRNSPNLGIPPNFSLLYGAVEIRAKVPRGQGYWPGFWLLPADHSAAFEPDVFEILGHDPTRVHMHYHYKNASGQDIDSGTSWVGPDFSAGFHTFAIDWSPTAVVWYIDGVERWRYTDAAHISSLPMILIANLAVGGSWPGSPDSSTVFPGNYNIDYIRAWARPGGSQPSVTSNLITNPSFERSIFPWNYPWILSVTAPAAATLTASTDAAQGSTSAQVQVTSIDSIAWHVGLRQRYLPTVAKPYSLNFWAKASANRNLGVIIQNGDSPFTEYLRTAIPITTTWTQYNLSYPSPVALTNTSLTFTAANNLGSVWLDDVYFGRPSILEILAHWYSPIFDLNSDGLVNSFEFARGL